MLFCKMIIYCSIDTNCNLGIIVRLVKGLINLKIYVILVTGFLSNNMLPQTLVL